MWQFYLTSRQNGYARGESDLIIDRAWRVVVASNIR